jgi:hypothetical protein
MYSPDGRFIPGAAETAHQVLMVFDPSVAGAYVCERFRGEGACRQLARN